MVLSLKRQCHWETKQYIYQRLITRVRYNTTLGNLIEKDIPLVCLCFIFNSGYTVQTLYIFSISFFQVCAFDVEAALNNPSGVNCLFVCEWKRGSISFL